MSRSAGPGSPVSFRCWMERRLDRNRSWREGGHEVELTGRERPYRPTRSMGSRSTFVSRQYRCSCGHVG